MYRIIKKSFGTRSVKSIAEVDVDTKIDDFCFIADFGFVFISCDYNAAGFVGLDGEVDFPWIEGLDNPVSFCYSEKNKSGFLIEDFGRTFQQMDVISSSLTPCLGSVSQGRANSFFKRIDKIVENGIGSVSSAIDDNGVMYEVNESLNRCFKIKGDSFEDWMGNGIPGYSVSNKLNNCYLRRPSGVACYFSDVYVCDSGNHCIRKSCGDSILLVAGNPIKGGDRDGIGQNCLLTLPRKLRIKNGMGFFIDLNKVKYLSIPKYSVGTVYESNDIVSIDISTEKDLFILEKV